MMSLIGRWFSQVSASQEPVYPPLHFQPAARKRQQGADRVLRLILGMFGDPPPLQPLLGDDAFFGRGSAVQTSIQISAPMQCSEGSNRDGNRGGHGPNLSTRAGISSCCN